ncbi:MAG: hypothetical protein K2X82_16180 [Gemmataceae bacterium]|nr:hypothetical protein [Gemmataceae bacterium]
MLIRAAGGVGLLALLVAASSGDAQGQWTWKKYTGKDSKMYFYPQWGEFKADGTAYLETAVGEMKLDKGTTLDEATVKVYKSTGIMGGFEPNPSITLTALNPGAAPNTISGPENIGGQPQLKNWTVNWGDNVVVGTQVVPTGTTVTVEVTIKTTTGGVQTTSVLSPASTSEAQAR